MIWQNNSYGEKRGYKFSYDGLNRLISSVYGERGDLSLNAGRYNERQEYDGNGNITRMVRNGYFQGTFAPIDNIEFFYHGNQYSGVLDHSKNNPYYRVFEYKSPTEGVMNYDYGYDGDGALTMDNSRGIALIDYDDLGNPKRIQFTNGNVTRYVYTATGQKLRTVYYTAVPNIQVGLGMRHELTTGETLYADSTDYLLGGNLILKNGRIDMFRFAGGYWEVNNWGNPTADRTDNFEAFYYNADHLGNIREVVRADGEMWQVTDYYPFGTPYDVSFHVEHPSLQPYRYNGKELDLMHGLNAYDYGARQLNPVIGRWDRMDPLCEKYYNVSPYAYCHNNPVMLVDPDGREVVADLNSINNIMRIVPENAMMFISFNINGILDANLLSRYEGKSYIMNSLKALAESKVCYIFESAAYDDNGKRFMDKNDNYYRGVTEFPKAENNASPDDDVHVIVGNNLSQEQQCETIAHEGLGHGYVYELTKSAPKSSHHYTSKKGNEYKFEGQKYYELIRVDDNEILNKQIRNVTEEAKKNIKRNIK